eukprot:CAMPEP_0183581886 /NCGR_PEP_ID=MMETSP0371-20130417/148607_1 /TAXON_ID=268820 /ORGANISM="Peridinium aciculiferum, Strain PAER-2" /LENGTH=37 /DNA_ID= /DNA_START= /DNA_END= /DNA_ORIENTATION=
MMGGHAVSPHHSIFPGRFSDAQKKDTANLKPAASNSG